MGVAPRAGVWLARVRAHAKRATTRALGRVPPARRAVEELARVEVVDRSMVISAQALSALVPLVVVLAAFLPADVATAGFRRFGDLTGVAQASTELVAEQLRVASSDSGVRAQTGIIGLVITVLSASSFARAVMRCYERIWQLPYKRGLAGRRHALGWLLVWLVGLQAVALVGRGTEELMSEWGLHLLRGADAVKRPRFSAASIRVAALG